MVSGSLIAIVVVVSASLIAIVVVVSASLIAIVVSGECKLDCHCS